MRSFWISLFVFVLLMCSCRSKKAATEVNAITEFNEGVRYTRYAALADTSRTLRVVMDKSKMRIIESIIVREYDKDTGIVTKETKTEREITQDSDKVATEEETERTEIAGQDSLNHIAGARKKVEAESKEESEGGQKSFGFGLVGIVLILFLTIKIRVSQHREV